MTFLLTILFQLLFTGNSGQGFYLSENRSKAVFHQCFSDNCIFKADDKSENKVKYRLKITKKRIWDWCKTEKIQFRNVYSHLIHFNSIAYICIKTSFTHKLSRAPPAI